MIRTIYLDMDGVLCDFYKAYKQRFRIDLTPLDGKAPKKEKEVFRKNFIEFIEEEGFTTLPSLKGCYDILRLCDTYKEVEKKILTSSGNEEAHEEISRQKKSWLWDHCIDYECIVVPGKRFKKDYAKKTALLIDDTLTNCQTFRDSGGIAIQHKGDHYDVVHQLQQIMMENQ